MKRNSYISYLIFYVVLVAIVSITSSTYGKRYKKESEDAAKVISQTKEANRIIEENKQHLAALSAETLKQTTYQEKWKARVGTYSTRESVMEIMRTLTNSNSLTPRINTDDADMAQSRDHKEQEKPSSVVKFRWKVDGNLINCLKWLAASERSLDFLQIHSCFFEVTNSGSVELTITAETENITK